MDNQKDTQAKAPRANNGMKRKGRKVCMFCADKIEHIDYKDTTRLRKCISERAKIYPRRITGTCAMHQRQLTTLVTSTLTIKRIPALAALESSISPR